MSYATTSFLCKYLRLVMDVRQAKFSNGSIDVFVKSGIEKNMFLQRYNCLCLKSALKMSHDSVILFFQNLQDTLVSDGFSREEEASDPTQSLRSWE